MQQFTTERPTFANDHLFQQLQSRGVTVNAKPPDQGAPLWEQLLLGLGLGLLLAGLLWWFWRRGGMSGLGGMGGMSRVPGPPLRPRLWAADHLRRCGRHR